MANLTPTPGWNEVFQLETDTPVLGGAGGVANSQAQALLNRTAFLEGATGSSKIGHTPAGTGAVATSVQNKLRESMSVKDFGADPSFSSAVNTIAMQAAIDATPVDGVLSLVNQNYEVSGVTINKRMTFKDGQLTLSSTSTNNVITLPTGTDGTILQNIKTVIGVSAATAASGIRMDNCTNIRLENCEGVGSKSVSRAEGVFHAQGGSNITFIDCLARDGEGEGIITYGTNNVTFIRCSGYGNANSAVGTSTGVGLYALDCYGENSGASGLTFNSQEMLIVNPKSKNNGSENGITVGHVIAGQYAEKVRVVNPICIGAPSIGLYVAYSTDVVIEGGEFYNCGTNAIVVDPNPGLTGTLQISGNIVIDGCQRGIDVTMPNATGLHDVIVSDVSVSNFSDIGIYVMINGDIVVESCKVKADPAVLAGSVGIRAHGSYTGSERSGTAKSITIRDNLIEDVATSAIYAFNCSRLSVIGNTFRDCNTSDSVGMPLIQTSGVIPSTETQLPMPNPFYIANNIALDSSTVAIFANAAVSTFDAVQKRLNFYNNSFDGTAVNTLDYDTTKYTLTSDIQAHGSIYLLNTNQTLANNTLTQLQLNASINVGGVTPDTTTAYSLTAVFDGLYLIGGRASFAASGTGVRELFVYKNGVNYTSVSAAQAAGENVVEFTLMLRLAKGDYVQLYARQTSGGNLDVQAASDDSRTNLWIARIGSR